MKKILIIMAAVFIVFIAAIIIFALTFDANRYKGVIIEKAGQAMQKDLALERISLDFSHGLGCRIEGLALKEKNAGWDKAWLKAGSAEVTLKILPLLKKDVQIDRVEINRLDLKLSDELLRQPIKPQGSSQGKVDTGAAALGALKFLAKTIVIKDSIITYTPAKGLDAVKLGISTMMLNNVSLSGPVRFSAVLSTLDKGRDNIILKGIAFPELSSKTPYIKDLDLKIDAGGIDIPAYLRAFGYADIAEQLKDKQVRGIVSMRSDKLLLDQDKILDSELSLKLSEFQTDAAPLKGGVKNLTLDAELSNRNLIIKSFSGLVAGGNISGSLTIKDLPLVINKKSAPAVNDFNFQINLADFDIQALFKAFGRDDLSEMTQGKKIQGNIVIKGGKLFLSPPDIYKSDISVSVSKLSTDIIGGKSGVSDVDIEASLRQGDLFIKKLSGVAAGGLISASGTIKNIEAVVSQKGILEAENVFAQFNLQDFNIPELLAMSGNKDAAKTLEGKTIAGKVTVKSDKFSLGSKEKSQGVSILVSQGVTDIIPIQGGVKDVELDATLGQNDLTVNKLTGSMAGGTFLIKGLVKDIFSSQLFNLDISCSDVDLDILLPQTDPKLPRFQGIADLKASIAGQGFDQDKLLNSLTGSGTVKINKPVLKSMNILRAAFDKMDMIPGLVTRLKENLSEQYTKALKQNDTNFKPMDIAFTISRGKLVFKDAYVESDGFLVKSQGEVGMTGDIGINSYLFIAPDLSQGFIDIVKELRFLANEQGMINMPLAITGKAPQVSVNIDRDYVIRKLLVSKGAELLDNIFNKKDNSQAEPQSKPDQTQQGTENSNVQQKGDGSSEPATLIKSIFDIIGSQDK